MLELHDVSFSYTRWRPRWVFQAVSWTVTPGATTLLLGPNGAGKSTLLKLLAGQHSPTRGSVTAHGLGGRDALFSNVAWMPQTIRPARGLNVREQLEYAAWVAGSSAREARSLAIRGIEMVKLAEQADLRSDRLSGGQLRRLGLAQACMRPNAEVLLLDEPTAGLDPAQTINFREMLDDLLYPGGVVISTHQVADVADHVDRVAVLSRGVILFDGSVDDFRAHGQGLGVSSGSLAEVFARMVQGGLH